MKVIIEVNRDVQLLAYRSDERLSMGNGHKFSLRMGFGLHAGWAIEGAVGSLQKVDATYLSPHVNMAARMEVATKQFGLSILITRSFYKVRHDAVYNHFWKVTILFLIQIVRYLTLAYSCCRNQRKITAEKLMLLQ